jgi:2-oxoglutarate dehydrogenase E1 component
VNGDDPEAVLFVTRLAVDYRMEFQKDVVIDLVCYRRRGHNEAEEPAKTQPLMYRRIRELPTTRTLYVDRLVRSGVLAQLEADTMAERYRQALESSHQVALGIVEQPDTRLFVDWSPYVGKDWTEPADTRLPRDQFLALAARVAALPDGFALHRQVERVREERARMAAGEAPVNWGYAEIMAHASLVDAGFPVRLTGQDVGVGTFSHRHVVYHDQETGAAWSALAHLREDVPFDVYDSLLSEEAVLAFEYGYASTAPNALVVWEAQFGDFANGAQVVIDQFISSGETKWARLCGLTLLLPHGQEGAGPEHSSARLERFLQLCAEQNMQVCVPSSPAQMFHLLRRQVVRGLRKPLIALTPKSLLRHRLAVSSLDELCEGRFHPVLPERDALEPEGVSRLVLCSGKVYYDLLEARRERTFSHVAIVRLEQLYPFPATELAQVLAPYRNLKTVVWCQEEPVNQGAWYSSQHRLRRVIEQHGSNLHLDYAGRAAFAAPAAGHPGLHDTQQRRLVDDALGPAPE